VPLFVFSMLLLLLFLLGFYAPPFFLLLSPSNLLFCDRSCSLGHCVVLQVHDCCIHELAAFLHQVTMSYVCLLYSEVGFHDARNEGSKCLAY